MADALPIDRPQWRQIGPDLYLSGHVRWPVAAAESSAALGSAHETLL
jgi:hypothetical protein